MHDLIGKEIGKYHIIEQLGEGGMATVYKALDKTLDRYVAIKVIRADKPLTKESLARFERDAKSLAKLTHANIVNVIDYGFMGNAPYLVMPFIPSGTLRNQLGKPVAWEQAFRMLLPVARALDYAHQYKIIHRDVKPSNILITESGDPMLTDFGIAKILEGEDQTELTRTGVGLGTPEYMAPEQVLGEELDGRADQYSLGIVLYELISGRKPFQADTPMAVAAKQASQPLPRITQFVAGLPQAIENFLVKVLSKDPGNRYAGMSEMVKAMDVMLSRRNLDEKYKPAQTASTTIDQQPLRKTTAPVSTTTWIVLACAVLLIPLFYLLSPASSGGSQPDYQPPTQNSAPPAAVVPTSTRAPSSTPRPTSLQYPTIRSGTWKILSGPSDRYPLVGYLKSDEYCEIIGISQGRDYLLIVAGNDRGWVISEVFEIDLSAYNFPVIETPPLPTPRPVRTTKPSTSKY